MIDAPDTPLPADIAAELARWADGEPPAGFVDRVVVAARRPPAPPRRRRWPLVAALAAALAIAASAMLLSAGAARAVEGARVVHEREAIPLGHRGVAVAEPGSEITWTIATSGAADIRQTGGSVFYRVEPGGPFAVETPYGRVLVRGTCFRVETVTMSMSRQAWLGGVVGAGVAAAIVITVYEGRVRVVNARGQADARPGDRVTLQAGAAPALDTAAPSLEPPPPGSATTADLLRRDETHRSEIALLRAQVRALQRAAAPADAEPPAPLRHDGSPRAIVDLSPPELAEMARNCEIRFDIPGYGAEPRTMSDAQATALGLSPDQRATYDRIARAESAHFMATLRSLYQELGGDGDNLDANPLMLEIMHKSPANDVAAARKRLAAERAGLAAPPVDNRNQSVVERLFRLETSAGTTLEQLLAGELGADKAHQIRLARWPGGDDAVLSGCPD